jgi:hypothetical protein
MTLTEAIKKRFRGSNDTVRGAFTAARHLSHPARFMTSRRVAQAIRPAPELALDPRQGFRIFPPGTFAEAPAIVEACHAVAADAIDESAALRRQGPGRKRFLVNLLDPHELHAEHPLMRLALRPDLLSSIVAYMGVVPVLRSIQLFYSDATERGPKGSQLFHCDADDLRQVKIFVLCTDVRAENGPLTLLDATRSARVRRAVGYRYHTNLTDEQVQAVIGEDASVQVTGDAGTVYLLDSSRCFHFGARVSPGAAPRLVAMVQYLSPAAFVLPGNYRDGAVRPDLVTDRMTPLQRAVVSGDHAHLDAIGDARR